VTDTQMNTLETLNLPTNSDSDEVVPLYVSDVIILQDQQFCQIVRLYNNQTVLIRILGTDKPKLVKTSEILINLSYISKKETLYNEKRQMRQSWKENEKIEVFSRSGGTWCVGFIMRKFLLRADKRIAHPDMWFQIVYYSATQEKLRYKQLKFDSKHIQKVSEITENSPFWKLLDDLYEPQQVQINAAILGSEELANMGLQKFARPEAFAGDEQEDGMPRILITKQNSVDHIHDDQLLENAVEPKQDENTHLFAEPTDALYKQSSLDIDGPDGDAPALFKQPSFDGNHGENIDPTTGEPVIMLGMIQRQNSETLPHELSPMMDDNYDPLQKNRES